MSSNEQPGARAQRRELARAARDAFPAMGVYAIRDRATGQVRVGASRNVAGVLNRIGFELRLGTHPDKALQAQWNAGGAERITFEVLALVQERSDPDFDYASELRALEELYREEFAQAGASA
jgi:hypothetical protein